MQTAKAQEVVAERDFSFGFEPTGDILTEPVRLTERARSVPARTKLVSSDRASHILESILPSHIIFYRVPVNDPAHDPSPSELAAQQRRGASPAAAALAAASAPAKPPVFEAKKIFGSVTTADMAESIKALIGSDEESARVVIGAEDISILGDEVEGSGIEGDRLKALGDFQVEVRVKGGEPVLRTVSVRSQDANPASP
ncbi:MAG: hypothetical protein Q9163_003381 [Psora crenata]